MKKYNDPTRPQLRTISVHTLEAVTGGGCFDTKPQKQCLTIAGVEICVENAF